MTEIDIDSIQFIGPNRDNVGRVFYLEGRVFRAINTDSVNKVRKILSCGLIDELVKERLFPKTTETNYKLNGYGLVLEHQKINCLTYPYEWSFYMLKDAALTILKVNLIAKKYDYQIKDGHGFNIMFDYATPMFVDLGSFVEIDDNYNGWSVYESFIRHLYYPLRIWAGGNGYIAQRILSYTNEYLSHSSYYLYRNPIYRMFNISKIQGLLKIWFKYKQLTIYPSELIKIKRPGLIGKLLVFFKEMNLLPFRVPDISHLYNKVEKISKKQTFTQWGKYHDQFRNDGRLLGSSPRFDRIIEIIKKYDMESVLEIGGNQGHFSRLLLERTGLKNVICTDYDENAVDQMYRIARSENIKLNPVLMNFMYPTFVNNDPTTYERFKSDAVIALAITHHLILTQQIPIDNIFAEISKYAKRYVFIEFMPLGLYSHDYAAPPVPAWYNLEWFKDAFMRYFKLIIVEQTEKNRVLFFGELLNDRDLIP